MNRSRSRFTKQNIRELEAAWRSSAAAPSLQRLLVLRLVRHGNLTADDVAKIVGVGRATVFRYLTLFRKGGIARLLTVQHAGGRQSLLTSNLRRELIAGFCARQWRSAPEIEAWLLEKGRRAAKSTIYGWIRSARKTTLAHD